VLSAREQRRMGSYIVTRQMEDQQQPGKAPLEVSRQNAPPQSPSPKSISPRRPTPRALGEALRAAAIADGGPDSGTETPSEEDYDENVRPSLTTTEVRYRGRNPASKNPQMTAPRRRSGSHVVPDEDRAIQNVLQRSSLRASNGIPAPVFGSFVFSRQTTTFDRHNTASVNSPFHGFYTLFWLAVALFVFKIATENWKTYGTPLGSNDIMRTMFHRDGRSVQL
jgi:sterol O-acyltransferase